MGFDMNFITRGNCRKKKIEFSEVKQMDSAVISFGFLSVCTPRFSLPDNKTDLHLSNLMRCVLLYLVNSMSSFTGPFT